MPNVAVLVYEEHELPPRSLFSELADIWAKRGLGVTVLQGPGPCRDVDALVLHVDLTIVPPEYLQFAKRFRVVINGDATDISKRRVSRNLVGRAESYEGPVIVKTDRNYGGLGEYRSARRAGWIRSYGHAIRNRMPWAWRSYLKDYRIFDSAREVPRGVWLNPDLVVEKFLPERQEGLYCLRTWLFFGEQERMALFRSRSPIVKGSNIISREILEEVPRELRDMRRELGFDFGKFDYALVDGKTILYDANRTPVLGGTTREESLPWLKQLAEGIWSFLPKGVG